MPLATFRLFLDNAPVGEEQLARLGEIRVDQGIGMAAEAEIELPVSTDPSGRWSGLEEDFVQPFRRVRVEVKVGDGDFVPLIDGPIVGNRFELHAAPDESRMALVVQDDSVLLNREEKVAVFENLADHDIASQLIAEHGLTPEVSTTPGSGAALERVVVQRGTNMQLLRELARRHGMFAYVRPGAQQGSSVGVLERPRTQPSGLPEILLLGPDRNVASFSAEFDALRPAATRADSVKIVDKHLLTAQAASADQTPLGDTAAHDVVQQPARTLLARTREEQADLDAATTAAANVSAWAYSASGEVDADAYAGVLTPYQVVRVAGIGGFLSGDFLVSRVTHVIRDEAYRQQFTLRRNARSAGTNAGGGALPGGIA
jgi:phage protein D